MLLKLWRAAAWASDIGRLVAQAGVPSVPYARLVFVRLGLCRRFAGLAEALFQRVHEINDVGTLRSFLGRGDDFSALEFVLHQIVQRGLVMVLEFLRCERAGFLGDELHGKIDHFFVGRRIRHIVKEIRRIAEFFRVTQHLHHQPVFHRRDGDEPFTSANGDLRQAHFAGFA